MIRIDLLKQKNNAKKNWSLVLKLVPLQPKRYLIMGSKDKLVERFKKKPKDFTLWGNSESFGTCWLSSNIIKEQLRGSNGSIQRMNHQSSRYHRPHPGSIMKEWMVKTIYQHLKNNGFIK